MESTVFSTAGGLQVWMCVASWLANECRERRWLPRFTHGGKQNIPFETNPMLYYRSVCLGMGTTHVWKLHWQLWKKLHGSNFGIIIKSSWGGHLHSAGRSCQIPTQMHPNRKVKEINAWKLYPWQIHKAHTCILHWHAGSPVSSVRGTE